MAKNMNTTLMIVLVVVGFLFYFGVPDFAGGQDTTDDTGGVCNVEDITFTPKMTRLGKAGTVLSGATDNYYITTNNLGATNGGSTVTVPTNYDMQILYGEASTTYYTLVKTVDTECSDPKFDAVALALADTSLNSYYALNSDGSVNSAGAEGMGADDEFETVITVKAGTDEYFGNPYSDCQNVAVLEYDKTFILKATGDNPTAVPGFFTYHNATYDGANAFYIPKSADGEKVEFNIKIESTATQPTTASADPRLHLYDCDVDKNEDTLELIEGVEDEDLNRISLQVYNLTVNLS